MVETAESLTYLPVAYVGNRKKNHTHTILPRIESFERPKHHI